MVGGRTGDWNLHPEHFAERHGLFAIIALGETLIVAAGGLTEAEMTPSLLAIGVLAVAVTCALWWSYFVCAKPTVDAAFECASGATQATMGRDAYTMVHFVMMLGVIAFAVAVEGVIVHPDDSLDAATRVALGMGVALFTGGMAISIWRATGQLPGMRVLLAEAIAIGVGLFGQSPTIALAMAFTGVVAITLTERRSSHSAADGVPLS